MINVGSNQSNVGRGPIFTDGIFRFIPIPESRKLATNRCRTYRQLGLADYVPSSYVDRPVHEDPEFVTFTYGHVRRGFGDMRSLKMLGKGDYLFFMATLSYKGRAEQALPWINTEWGAYIVAFFKIDLVCEISELLASRNLRNMFAFNAHMKRKKPDAQLWIKGIDGALLQTAIPLSDAEESTKPNAFTRRVFTTVNGRNLSEHDKYWYRWTLATHDEELSFLLKKIKTV